MKEASGELSMTAVAVVAIAAVGVLFTTLIWPSIKGQLIGSSKCSSAFNCDCGTNGTDKTCKCHYYTESGAQSSATVSCPNPNNTTTQAAVIGPTE